MKREEFKSEMPLVLLGQTLCDHCLDAEKANIDQGSPFLLEVISESSAAGVSIIKDKAFANATMPITVVKRGGIINASEMPW